MLDRVLAGAAVLPLLLGATAAPSEDTRVVFAFDDADIVESSGLVALGEELVTTNDSGDSGRLFVVDRAGRTVEVVRWSEEPDDVEALAAAGADAVWVGDIGDNREVRDTIEVTRVPVRPAGGPVGPTYSLVYPDGAHDAETLLSDPVTGRLYVVTKSFVGGAVYAAPEVLAEDGPNPLTPVGGPVLPLATDGTLLTDGRHALVRSYTAAGVYTFPEFEEVATFTLPPQELGEGIAVDASGAVYLSSEGARSEVLRIALPETARAALGSSAAGPPPAEDGGTLPADERPGEETVVTRPVWPWALGGLVGLVMVVVLLRSLKPR